jgi:hypothetical protein
MQRLSPASRLVIAAVLLALGVWILVLVVGAHPAGPAASGENGLAGQASAARPAATAMPSPTSIVIATASARATAPRPTSTELPAPARPISLATLLARLPVATEHRDGYERTLFRHWIDADGDGCDTRREVLIDEARTSPDVGSGCRLTGGSWFSLYDGKTVTDTGDLDIDHVVALAEAWDSGAYAWTAPRREAYANDLVYPPALIAVSATSNRQKGDKDPTDWLPSPSAALCPYVAAWIEVKARWNLSVDTAEHEALTTLVGDCPDTRVSFEPAP